MKKREQRGRWIKRILIAGVVIWGLCVFYSKNDMLQDKDKPHIGLIDVKGGIFGEDSGSAENFNKALDKAYESKGLKAIILRIDSPGGSPVQADYMYDSIRYHQSKYKKVKVYAVCVDLCASAAYYLASAADEIYASPSSMVGSIGVLFNGFGFVDSLNKLGVTRRLVTAGRNKGFMDPFSPVDAVQEQHLEKMLDEVHQEFIAKVKKGRGSRLVIDDDTFSGLIWTGLDAKQRGLIDGFASAGQLAREVIQLETIIDYSYKENPFEKVAKHMGVAMVDALPEAFGFKARLQ